MPESMPEGVPEDLPPQFGEPEASAGARKLPRAVGIALATAGLLAVTATSAAVTVAVGKPDRSPRAVVLASAPHSVPTPTTAPAPTAGATPVPLPSTPPAPAPAPSSTVHGSVDGDTHGGDIRYFLLPIPAGGESYGSTDGVTLTSKEVASEFGNADDMGHVLDSYGYQDDAAVRHYRSADGQQEVTSRLLRFKSARMAKEFAKGMSFKSGDSFDIDGDSAAQGIVVKPDQDGWLGELIGVSSVGDVEYQVTVLVKGNADKALLMDAMKRQRDQLANGG
ncbi:hypothetical protein [Kitasatospora sp. MAP5-34]|uniref:hypothetical protein n=1 Tax=Kitasatospora sp. MAP5-34 TaxID=3035102 RepID=UPI0024732FA1|nr:hypothetical protein [Kitasatospora sp. MAP5-34]MDH6577450.1 ribosomal protein L21E [Kitasatospora sp. MAP5-34]